VDRSGTNRAGGRVRYHIACNLSTSAATGQKRSPITRTAKIDSDDMHDLWTDIGMTLGANKLNLDQVRPASFASRSSIFEAPAEDG
jgi:hypothetical protein